MARKNVTISLDPELINQFEAFVVMENFGSKNQAMNAILRQHFAATPEMGAVRAARERALAEARAWVMDRVTNAMREISQTLELSR